MKPNSIVVGFLCLCLLSCSAGSDQKGISAASPQGASDSADPVVSPTNIPLISVSDTGREEVREMPPVEYHSHLSKLFPAVEGAVLPAVNQTRNSNPWGLRTVVVGVGLKLGFGGTPLGIGASAGVRLAFSNSVKPSIP